jgi:hypothetical protein
MSELAPAEREDQEVDASAAEVPKANSEHDSEGLENVNTVEGAAAEGENLETNGVEQEPEFLEPVLDGESLTMDDDEDEDDIDDDELEASDDPMIKKIRKVNRKKNHLLKERDKEIDRLNQVVDALQSGAQQETQPSQVGPANLEPSEPPKYEDFDTDEEFNKATADHYTQEVDKAKLRAEYEAQAKEQQEAWDQRRKLYDEGKTRFKGDFKKSEVKVMSHMSEEQLGIVVHAAKDPSLLVRTLAADPKAAELTAEKDPVRFAVALGDYQVRVSTKGSKKQKPTPEKMLKGGAAAGTVDSQLAKLEADARKTGSRTKLIKYKESRGLL